MQQYPHGSTMLQSRSCDVESIVVHLRLNKAESLSQQAATETVNSLSCGVRQSGGSFWFDSHKCGKALGWGSIFFHILASYLSAPLV